MAKLCAALLTRGMPCARPLAPRRPWFAWANSLFGELIVKLSRERPHLIGINASLV